MGAVVVFQRSRHMEKAEAPQCRSFHRRYVRTPADCVEVDPKWNPNQVRRETSERESSWLGESFLWKYT